MGDALRLLTALTFTSWALAANAETEGRSDSGIDGPPYRDIVQQMATLELEFPHLVKVESYGQSVFGVNLTIVKIEDRRAAVPRYGTSPRPAVLISGATHGNEYLAIEDRLPGEFARNRGRLAGVDRFLQGGGVIYIVPILNPDGYDRDQRENGNYQDLNRDFPLPPQELPGLYQPETRQLVDFLRRDTAAHGLQLRLSVDYHCCAGALLYPWSYTDMPMSEPVLAAHRRTASMMKAALGDGYVAGTSGEILGYLPVGTSKDFYLIEFGAQAFTFEGTYAIESSRFLQHVKWWDEMLGDSHL